MKTQVTLKIAPVVAILALSGTANATVADFNALPSDQMLGSTYAEHGLTFTSNNSQNMFHWGQGTGNDADPTGDTMAENYAGSPIDVALTAGGAFTLNSIDFADVYNQGAVRTIHLNYVDGSGSHAQTFLTDGVVGLQTVQFGYAGVTSFSLTGDNWFQMDNVTYNATSAVPELGTMGMMLAGLALVGASARRRKA